MIKAKPPVALVTWRVLFQSGVLAFAAVTSATAGENLMANGTFVPASATCEAGTTSIPSWTVVAGNVDVVDAACNSNMKGPDSTSWYLDLTGSYAEDGENDVGTLAQTVTTVVGKSYQLTFYFGGNPQWQGNVYPNDSALKVMTVYVNDSIAGAYSVATAGVAYTDAQWQRKAITFTATSTSTTITFESLNGSTANPSDFGPQLGNVVLKEAVRASDRRE